MILGADIENSNILASGYEFRSVLIELLLGSV